VPFRRCAAAPLCHCAIAPLDLFHYFSNSNPASMNDIQLLIDELFCFCDDLNGTIIITLVSLYSLYVIPDLSQTFTWQ
jgi:hypothetical protein